MHTMRLTALVAAACVLLAGLPVPAFAEASTTEAAQGVAPASTVTPEPAATQGEGTETPAQSAAPVSTPLDTEPTATAAQTADTEPTATAAQTADTEPTPSGAQAADGEPTPTATQAADGEPTPTATQAADTGPTPTAGVETPTPTPGVEASPPPSAEASPSPTPTAGETTPAPAVEGPAWYWDGTQKYYGELEALLLLTEETIYIASDELFTLTGEAAQMAQEADLALDPDVFPEEEQYVLWLSDIGPAGETEEDTLYLWAGKEEDAPPEPSPTPEPTAPTEIEAELLVVPEMYRAGAWSSTAPSFTLTAVPDTLTGYTFAVSIDEGDMQAVESPFLFSSEGQHTLTFALIDPDGTQVARSAAYTVWLDMAAPEAQAQFDMQTGMLTVTATDAMSGVDAISLDGGKTWQPMTAAEDGSFVYSAPLTAQVAAGDLMVRDATGNCWQSAESYGMPGGMGGNFGGMGGSFGGSFGGGGGSSGTTRTVSHSSGSEEEATAYGAVALEVEEGSMFVLTLGGETLPLTLALDYEAGGVEDTATTFTAELAVWNGTGEEDYDTLILTARDDGAESPYAYRWDFSGDVYKTLFNSGVQYLVLRVGDRVTALSTAGFTAGTAYNALKSEGAASSEFAYSLWMGEPDPALEMEVEARGTRYLLDAGEGDMYYYDVYTGDMDMLSAAFGATQQEEQ